MKEVLMVALGGAFGSVARLAATRCITSSPSGFPTTTLLVNLLGSFLIGVIAMRVDDPTMRAFLMTGILGGFTTFSAFSLDVISLLQRGSTTIAFAYVGASILLCIGGAYLGTIVGTVGR